MREMFTAGNRVKSAVAKSEKDARIFYTKKQFSREEFVAISSVELCARNFQHGLFSLNLL